MEFCTADYRGQSIVVVLPDVLSQGLKVVFCGSAVGPTSARVGAYYAGPGNQFWDVLPRIGLTPRRFKPEDFGTLLDYGVGLTDLAKRRSGTDDQLDSAAFDVEDLRAKMRKFAPMALAFNGKRAATEYFGSPVAYGRQPQEIESTTVFVLPSTSGAARGYWNEDFWKELAAFVLSGKESAGSVLAPGPEGRSRTMATSPGGRSVTLHDELAAISRANGNRWMTTQELAGEVNRRGRYSKRDRSAVTAFQVHGRTRKYSHMFERDGSRVRLVS